MSSLAIEFQKAEKAYFDAADRFAREYGGPFHSDAWRAREEAEFRKNAIQKELAASHRWPDRRCTCPRWDPRDYDGYEGFLDECKIAEPHCPIHGSSDAA